MSKIHQTFEKNEKQIEVELFEKKDYTNKKNSINANFLMRNKIAQLVESSTSHGLPNIVRSERVSIKLLWTICFVGSFSVCSYMVFLSVSQFLEYSVVTQSELLTETKSIFPTISICMIDPLTSFYSQQLANQTYADISKEEKLLNQNLLLKIFF